MILGVHPTLAHVMSSIQSGHVRSNKFYYFGCIQSITLSSFLFSIYIICISLHIQLATNQTASCVVVVFVVEEHSQQESYKPHLEVQRD